MILVSFYGDDLHKSEHLTQLGQFSCSVSQMAGEHFAIFFIVNMLSFVFLV